MFKILNNLQKLTLMLSVLSIVMISPASSVALEEGDTSLRVSSTIAGFDTFYTLNGTEDSKLILLAPDGDKTEVNSRYSKIDGKHLKQSGSYTLVAATKVGGVFSSKYEIQSQAKFEVLPEDTDANRSRVEFLTKPALGVEVPVVVTLKDKYGNPVDGHEVTLLADSSAEIVRNGSGLSNEDGKVLFTYKKLEAGKDKLLAMDKNDDVLLSTIEISKFAAASVYGFGGDLVSLAEGDRFEFSSTPSTVEPYETFSFTLDALDESQTLDDSYTGTVRFFTTTDDLAVLPDDYTFDALDGGTADFDDAFFAEEGTHQLEVVDVDNGTLIGSVEIEVEFAGLDGGDAGGSEDLTVTSPTAGESNSSVINFKGTTDPGLEVNVFDNGEILTAEDADVEGNFDFNSPVLDDGTYVFTLTAGDATSEEIEVTIDTSADLLNSIVIEPSEVSADSPISFSVDLSEDASRVSVVINEQRDDLIQADTVGRSFSGIVNAPSTDGEYDVDLIIVDLDGGSTTLSAVGTVEVDSEGSGELTFNVPSQVLGVNVLPGDKRVNLSWNAAFDNTGITNYRVNYGIDPNLLLNGVDTNDSSTTWYVPNLSNGTTYYFQIFGVDTEGNLSDQGSQIVSATPSAIYGGGLHGSADGQVTVNQVTESGPEIYVLLVFAAFLAYWFRLDKKFI